MSRRCKILGPPTPEILHNIEWANEVAEAEKARTDARRKSRKRPNKSRKQRSK